MHRAQGVGCIADRNDLGALAEGIAQACHVQGVILDIEIYPAHGRATILGHHHPGSDVGVVIHARQNDLIARPDLPSQCPADAKG